MVEVDGKTVVANGVLIIAPGEQASISSSPTVVFEFADESEGKGLFTVTEGSMIRLRIGHLDPTDEYASELTFAFSTGANFAMRSFIRRFAEDWTSGPIYHISYQLTRTS